jgi:ABC-type proline/glycine betaine transport system ATPase subunit
MVAKKKPLKVALCGMDSRTTKTMALFLHGPCSDAAIVVNPEDAEVSIFDADLPVSKKLLEKHVEGNLQKPLIILSIWDVMQEGALHLKKPVNTENMSEVLDQAKKLMADFSKVAEQKKALVAQQRVEEIAQSQTSIADLARVKVHGSSISAVDLDKFKHVQATEEDILELLNYGLTNPKKAKLTIVVDARIVKPDELDDWFESGL